MKITVYGYLYRMYTVASIFQFLSICTTKDNPLTLNYAIIILHMNHNEDINPRLLSVSHDDSHRCMVNHLL